MSVGFLVHLRTAKENAMHHLEMSLAFWVAVVGEYYRCAHPGVRLGPFEAMYIMGGEL